MMEIETDCWSRIYLDNDVSKTFSSSVDVNAPKLARAGVESGAGMHKLVVVRNHVVARLPSLLEAVATVI